MTSSDRRKTKNPCGAMVGRERDNLRGSYIENVEEIIQSIPAQGFRAQGQQHVTEGPAGEGHVEMIVEMIVEMRMIMNGMTRCFDSVMI